MKKRRSKNQLRAIWSKLNKPYTPKERKALKQRQRIENVTTGAQIGAVSGALVGSGVVGPGNISMAGGVTANNQKYLTAIDRAQMKVRRTITSGINKLPKGISSTPAARRVKKVLNRGRRISVYHAAPGTVRESILKEGLRSNRGSTFNFGFTKQSGRVYVGKPGVVSFHGLLSKSPAIFKSRIRRASLTKDLEHLGSYVVKSGHVATRTLKEVPLSKILINAGIKTVGLATIGGVAGGYGVHKLYKRFEKKPRVKRIKHK